MRREECVDSDSFKQKAIARAEKQSGKGHVGVRRRASAESKAERIMAQELKRLVGKPGLKPCHGPAFIAARLLNFRPFKLYIQGDHRR